jgi:hypothetical protein
MVSVYDYRWLYSCPCCARTCEPFCIQDYGFLVCDAVLSRDFLGEPAAYVFRAKEPTGRGNSFFFRNVHTFLPDTRRHISENRNLNVEPGLMG